MTTGTSTWNGLGMGLFGEYELTQIQSAVDCLTITGASTTGTGTLFTVQNSDAAPATNGFRIYDYGRTRLIRTDAVAHGGAYKNALDVKYDLDYAAGAVQVYAATFILDVSGGSATSGRQAVVAMQSYGNAQMHSGPESSWFYLNDVASAETSEVGSFINFGGGTIAAANMLRPISNPDSTHGLVMYWDNTLYFIMVSDGSG